MAGPEYVFDHAWPSGVRQPICTLNVRVGEIARIHGLPLERWIEDGLGPAEGLTCRVRRGLVVLLVELQPLIEQGRAKGPDVYVDLGDVAASGVDDLIRGVLEGLELPPTAVAWRCEISKPYAAERLVQLQAQLHPCARCGRPAPKSRGPLCFRCRRAPPAG